MLKEGEVSVPELKRLLVELKDLRPDILVRVRILGEMWQSSFCRVVRFTDLGVVLRCESGGEFFPVKDFNHVVQFEIDSAFQVYRPHNHYSIKPQSNLQIKYADTGS